MRSWLWFFGIALALSTATAVFASEPVTIRVNPRVSVAPTMLAIRVRVAPHPDNQALEIVLDSSNFYRLSQVQLHGDRGPIVNTLKVDSVPAGHYKVTATVIGADGQRDVASAYVEVRGGALNP